MLTVDLDRLNDIRERSKRILMSGETNCPCVGEGFQVNCLEHFFFVFQFANKVFSTVCNVSKFVLTP
jgi:hypothetical protein